MFKNSKCNRLILLGRPKKEYVSIKMGRREYMIYVLRCESQIKLKVSGEYSKNNILYMSLYVLTCISAYVCIIVIYFYHGLTCNTLHFATIIRLNFLSKYLLDVTW